MSSQPHRSPIRRTKMVATLGPASDRRIDETRGDHMNAHGGTNTLKILEA
ncbi:MAG: hypothetical protein LC652_05470 [Halomonas sp.]|nr:hypothetical protein [Halomonas sp.]